MQNVQLDPSAFVADPELISALEKRSIRIPCDADRLLFSQGDPAIGVFVLYEGAATVTMNANSDEPVLTLQAAPGSLLGLPGVIVGQPYSLTANARQGSQVLFISRDDFTDLMRCNPQLSLKVLQVLAAEVRTARRALY